MEELRGWIINICTAVFFITAVEMILPDNNLKKYAKFVLGLILITVIINPFVMFISGGKNIQTIISSSNSIFESDVLAVNSNEYKNKGIENTAEIFKTNLENLCKKKLKEKYEKNNYEVKAEVYFDKEKEQYIIKALTINVIDNKVEKVQKVEIKTNSTLGEISKVESEYSSEIRDFLSSELEIPKNIIGVYRGKT